MRFILDAIGVGGNQSFQGDSMPVPTKATYISASGAESTFDFEDVDSAVESRAAVFDSAGGNGTYVQRNGHTSARLPMSCIFHGKGYLQRAEAFVSSLLEDGEGRLKHPSYDRPIAVIPVGEITITDRFKSGGNQRIISLQFFETTGLKLGSEKGRDQLFDSFEAGAAEDFSDKVQLSDPTAAERFKNKALQTVKTVQTVMKNAIDGAAGVTRLIEDAGDSIDRGIDSLVGQPLTFARQVQVMCGEPRRQVSGVRAKLNGYKGMAQSIFGLDDAEVSNNSVDSLNDFHLNQLTARAMVSNYAMMSADGFDEYFTRADYIEVAEDLRALMDSYQEWNDSNYENIATSEVMASNTDVGGGMLDLRDLVAAAISALIEGSFNAKTEMVTYLDSDRVPLELCYELYGTAAGSKLDLFYLSNGIAGEEHFLLRKGRRIVHYV